MQLIMLAVIEDSAETKAMYKLRCLILSEKGSNWKSEL